MSEMVDITLSLDPKLKASIRKAAKEWGVDVNELIVNALESRVRQEIGHGDEKFVRHGGKHKFGKSTGYEVTADGSYYPAPLWTERFEELFAERLAIHNLVNGLVQTVQERLIAVEKQILKAKNDLIDDLGLDPTKQWAYYGGGDNCLREIKPEPSKENE